MNLIRAIVLKFASPSTRASIEAESRQWMLKCPNCGFERSYWDSDGIRWKAAGNPRIRRKCPSCGKTGWFRVYKKETV